MNTVVKLTDRNGIGIETGQDVKEILTDDYGYNDYYVSGLFIYSLDEDKNTVLLKQYDDDNGYVVPCDEIEVIVDIKELAEQYNLDYIETTTGSNGYPQNLQFAITGFDSFEKAQELADMYNLRIESFEKRDGWQLWSRRNNWMYQAYQLDVNRDFGDNYSEEDQDQILNTIKEIIDEVENPVKFLNSQIELLEECEKACDDEVVISHHGEYFDTLPKESMTFYHDTRHYIIGLIQN